MTLATMEEIEDKQYKKCTIQAVHLESFLDGEKINTIVVDTTKYAQKRERAVERERERDGEKGKE